MDFVAKFRDRARGAAPRLGAFLAGALAALSAMPVGADVPIQSRPLSLGNDVPHNMAFVPSVEFPTLISVANYDKVNGVDTYNAGRAYVGYFDSEKCYAYVYTADEKDSYFRPVSKANARQCSATNKEWSGNFMNWAATQTIDPFRKALTGGYRVKDTVTETWLEKANSDGRAVGDDYYFPNKIVAAAVVGSVLPAASAYDVQMRISSFGSQMYVTRNSTPAGFNSPASRLKSSAPVRYNPATHSLSGRSGNNDDPTVYAISVRVAVCVPSVGLEANCVKYPGGYKPEGLIQRYNDKFRYSVFSYLNDNRMSGGGMVRDGGVLRSNQKYVGPYTYDPKEGRKPNAATEWDPSTGILNPNPDPQVASKSNTEVGGGSVVNNSGVINYINKFSQTTTFPSRMGDSLAELYYTMVRYFKNLGNVPEYSTVASANAVEYTDRFPVVTDWQNPIQYRCQRNVSIGIADVYNNGDRNLPINTRKYIEPSALPALVAADNSVSTEAATDKVFRLEGYASTVQASGAFRGNNGVSALVAGLAYDSHTVDLQPKIPDKQTLDTYWVDVAEGQKVESVNQLYLAAKYGGFDVPAGYAPYQNTTPLPDAWWTNGDLVGLANMQGVKRPRNYFVAAQADKMVNSLVQAFEAAAESRVGAAGGLATNGATLEEGASVYAATFYTDWHGDLKAYRYDPATKAYVAKWSASSGVPAPAARKIYANSAGYRTFAYDLLSSADQANLGSGGFSGAGGREVLDYLRGDRSKEVANGGPLRNRAGVLGDFVHSTPMYVGRPSPSHYAYSTFLGGGKAYMDFAAAKAGRTPMVYVGGNDGMLHGFNADTGAEAYAFVPQAALKIPGGLAGYASPRYQHRYFVDGELTVADVYVGGAWKTVLIGTMGRGGKGVFALDITDPADVKFLWEKYDDDIPALGNNLGKPVVVQTGNGVWKVLLGNGPNGTGGKAQLLILDVADGRGAAVDTGAGTDNGLSGVRPWDSDNDGFADSAYAGDFAGNLWRFGNLAGATTATRLFQATDAAGKGQAITAAPLVGRKPDSTEVWVFFGTGRYLDGSDLGDKSIQAWYGLIDKGRQVSKSELTRRAIELEATVKDKDGNDVGVRAISAARSGDMDGKAGWYIDLVPPSGSAMGERMVVPNLFDGNRLLGISRIPNVSDPCEVGDNGWTMEIDPFTGARLDVAVYDANGDGSIDAKDYMAGGQQGTKPIPPSGVSTKGSLNPALIIPGGSGNIVTGTNQNGELIKQPTPVTGIGVKRVSWREVLRDG